MACEREYIFNAWFISKYALFLSYNIFYCHLQPNLGYIKEGVEVNRDELGRDKGQTFWAWAERLLDEHAERSSEPIIHFMGKLTSYIV